jgi:hypothetical protein
MRRCVYLAISFLISASLLSVPVFSSGKTANREHPLKNIRAKAETGAKVGQRIKQLRRTSKALQSALEAFERNGRQPSIDEAVSIFGHREKTHEIAKAHHARQQATISGDGAEVIFITALHMYNEWQGTVITRFFDANGALEDEFVSNLVITRSEYSPAEWTVRHDVEYGADGVGYLFHRPGMFTSFQLGTPIQAQAAPLGLESSQFRSTTERDLFYQQFPEQLSYDTLPGGGDGGGGGGGGPGIILNAHAKAKAPQSGGQTIGRALGPWMVPSLTGWRGAARDAGLGCTATAGGCALGSALFSGAPFVPCFVTGCAGSVIYGVLANVRPTRVNIRP